MILNYEFKDILEDKLDPVNWIKENSQFKELYPIMDKTNKDFILTKEDINNIFEFKKNLNYKEKDNKLLLKEINRIRNINNN
jgi:ADP-dependent phosphofructokinase/glucokinase